MNRVRQHGTRLPANIIAHLEQGLWEVRPEYGDIEYRFFFFLRDAKVGVVSAVVKKRPKIGRDVIERALRLAEQMRTQWEQTDDE